MYHNALLVVTTNTVSPRYINGIAPKHIQLYECLVDFGTLPWQNSIRPSVHLFAGLSFRSLPSHLTNLEKIIWLVLEI